MTGYQAAIRIADSAADSRRSLPFMFAPRPVYSTTAIRTTNEARQTTRQAAHDKASQLSAPGQERPSPTLGAASRGGAACLPLMSKPRGPG
jgi:hypothetical protein